MRVCNGCGYENPQDKHFCTECGQLLPDRSDTEPASQGTSGFFGTMNETVSSSATQKQPAASPKTADNRLKRAEASTPAEPSDNTSTNPFDSIFQRFATASDPSEPPSTGASEPAPDLATGTEQPAPGERVPRAEALKRVATAAIKAGVKSLALSAAVLGPGFLLLMTGALVPGMIWLFFGSFGLMAWTYRKPWRLGWISCLIPPVVALVCYLVQLGIFQQTPPASWLLWGIALGAAIGFVRGQAHDIYTEDGGVFAQRTILYLLVWAVAYGVSQTIVMASANLLAIRGGLVTGAMTTAMLVMVSIMLVRRWRLAASVPCILIALACSLAMVERAEAKSSICWIELPEEFILYTGPQVDAPSGTGCSNTARARCDLGGPLPNSSIRLDKGAIVSAIPKSTDRAPRGSAETRFLATNPDTRLISRTGLVNALCNAVAARYESQNTQPGTQNQLPGSGIGVPDISSWLPDMGTLLPDLGGYDPPVSISPQAIAAATAAVAGVLIAAGIAINIAQAAATAVAQALQAGVQLTAEEVQSAIADALFRRTPEGEGDKGTAHQQDPPPYRESGSAPPNVQMTERVRPPAPIYDENNEPFQTNEDGQYLAPDKDGDWRWMSRQEAQEASRAVRRERAAREQSGHARQAEENLARSRQTMHEKDGATRAEEERQRQESDARREEIARAGERDDPRTDPESYSQGVPGWDNTDLGWWSNMAGTWVTGSAEDTADLVVKTPGALLEAAGSALETGADIVTDPESWRQVGAAAGAGADFFASQIGIPGAAERNQDRIDTLGRAAAKVGGHLVEQALDDPRGAAIGVARTVLGADNWEKATDPDTPVTERFGRSVWGAAEAVGTLISGGTTAARAAGKLGGLIRGGDRIGEAARVLRAADDVADFGQMGRAANAAEDAAELAARRGKVPGTGQRLGGSDLSDVQHAGEAFDEAADSAHLGRRVGNPDAPGGGGTPPSRPTADDVAAAEAAHRHSQSELWRAEQELAEAQRRRRTLPDDATPERVTAADIDVLEAEGRVRGRQSDEFGAALDAQETYQGHRGGHTFRTDLGSGADDIIPDRRPQGAAGSPDQPRQPSRRPDIDDADPITPASRRSPDVDPETPGQAIARNEEAIDNLSGKIDELKGVPPGSQDYDKTQERLAMLEQARRDRRADILSANDSQLNDLDGRIERLRNKIDGAEDPDELVALQRRQRELELQRNGTRQEIRTQRSDHVAQQINRTADAGERVPAGLTAEHGSFEITSPGRPVSPNARPSAVEQAIQTHVDSKGGNSGYQSWTGKRQVAASDGTRGFGGDQLAVAMIPTDEFRRMQAAKEALLPRTVSAVTTRSGNIVEQEALLHRVAREHWRMETPELRRVLGDGKGLPLKNEFGLPRYKDANGDEFIVLYRSMHPQQFPQGTDFLK